MTRAAPMPPEQRRAAIVEATVPLLEEHGQSLTTRMVAEAAGVAEGTIFRVFASLDDLVAATVAEALSHERLARRLDHARSGDTIESRTLAALELIESYLHSVHTMVIAAHGANHHAATCARDQLEDRSAELDGWVASQFAPHVDDLTLAPDVFATLLRTLAVGHAARFVSSSLSLADLARIALHGAFRKDTSCSPA